MGGKGSSQGYGFPGILEAVMNGICRGILSLILALCLAALVEAAESQGTFEVRIKDHREAIGDFSQLTLTVGELLISPKPGLKFWQSGWKGLAPARESIDLTKYVGKNSVQIFRGSLNTGTFDAIHLKLTEVSGLLKKGQRSIKIKNTVGPIKLPFEIRHQGETAIVLDLVVLDMSDHPPAGYELGIKGYEVYTNGKLVDKVPPGP
jgi:Domain of unknown function (DUF4382)